MFGTDINIEESKRSDCGMTFGAQPASQLRSAELMHVVASLSEMCHLVLAAKKRWLLLQLLEMLILRQTRWPQATNRKAVNMQV